MEVSLLTPMCVCRVFVCVCDIKSWSTSKKSQYASDLSKLDALLHKTYSKNTMVPRSSTGRSIISLTRITHQMWCDHPFCQRKKATKRAVKKGGLSNIGGSS